MKKLFNIANDHVGIIAFCSVFKSLLGIITFIVSLILLFTLFLPTYNALKENRADISTRAAEVRTVIEEREEEISKNTDSVNAAIAYARGESDDTSNVPEGFASAIDDYNSTMESIAAANQAQSSMIQAQIDHIRGTSSGN